jgi:hypothetical protein
MFDPWMLSRDTCQLLVERLQTLRPKVAVEFGSGFSTALIALYSDRLVSLEHSAAHAAPWPCVTVCKLRDGRYQTPLPDGVEFALIDGPPAHKYGRDETFPQLWPHLADRFEVWLDDYDRDHEQQIVADWQTRFPITVERVGSVKGLAIIRRAT